MDQNRILELAVEALQRQKAGIDAEIETIRAALKGTGSPIARKANTIAAVRGRSRTTAERRTQSLRMRQYWAAKRAKAAKSSAAITAPVAGAKPRQKSAAERKALSLKMKQVWKKRKAEAAKKATPKI